MVVGINEDGILNKTAFRLGYSNDKTIFFSHPDTGISFEGYKLPMIREIAAAACILHTRAPNIGMVSWDFTVDDCGKIVLIETNLLDQSVWFPQIVQGESLFGKDTKYMIHLLLRGVVTEYKHNCNEYILLTADLAFLRILSIVNCNTDAFSLREERGREE